MFGSKKLRAELAATRAELELYRSAVERMASVCHAAARGDLEPRVPDLEATEELDVMRRALNHLLDLTDAFVREAGAALTYASEGKFYRRVLSRGLHGTFRDGAVTINRATGVMEEGGTKLRQAEAARLALADEFEGAIRSVSVQVAAASTELRATAESLASIAERTASESVAAAAASTETSSNAASIAASTEELASTVTEIERQVAAASEASQGAVAESARARDTVAGLDVASGEIGQVVAMITAIAAQTRLLALNATIEAARAGAAGKGFGIVAAEVKELASQTATATEQIERHVTAIQGAADGAVQAITSIGGAIERLDLIAGMITTAVGEQRVATTGISRSIQETSGAATAVSESVAIVQRSTEETSQAAGNLEAAACELSRLGERLGCEVDRFLRQIRGEASPGPNARSAGPEARRFDGVSARTLRGPGLTA